MVFSAEEMAQMAQKGGLPGQPEVGPWADPEFPPVHGRARKLVLSRRTEGLLAYSAASAAAVDAEVVARGLEPLSTKVLNVELLKRSDSAGLAVADRKAGSPDTILTFKAAELSWAELRAAAERLKMNPAVWVTEGHEAKRFASLLVHFGGEPEVPGEEEEADGEAEAEGLSLSEADWDALVIEAMDLGVADFSDKANSKRRAALLTRQVKMKRKRASDPSGSAKKAASESDLATVSESVDMLGQLQASDGTRFDAQFKEIQARMAEREKKDATKEEFQSGQMRLGMSTLQWQNDILRGQYNTLEPLLKLALESGDQKLVKAMYEKIDLLVVANKKTNGTQLMFKVLATDVSPAEQKVENKFDVAHKRVVQDAKDMKILQGYEPYASAGGGSFQPPMQLQSGQMQMQQQALAPFQQQPSFGGMGRSSFPQMGAGPALPPMGRGQQPQLGGMAAPLQLGWQPPPGAMPGMPGAMPGMMPPPGAQGAVKAFLEPRVGTPQQGGSRVLNTMTGAAWPLRPMSSINPNPGQPVRGLASPVRAFGDGSRQECQICGDPAGPGGHLVFECPTARSWMQRGWVTDLAKPTAACPKVQ